MNDRNTSLSSSLKAGRDFAPTLSIKELVGKVFTLLSFRDVTTQFGDRRVASITLNGSGETVDAWLSGAILDGQLDKLVEDEQLPAIVKLTTDPNLRDAYVLEEPIVGETFEAESAAPAE